MMGRIVGHQSTGIRRSVPFTTSKYMRNTEAVDEHSQTCPNATQICAGPQIAFLYGCHRTDAFTRLPVILPDAMEERCLWHAGAICWSARRLGWSPLLCDQADC
jgi:hypothetical protein